MAKRATSKGRPVSIAEYKRRHDSALKRPRGTVRRQDRWVNPATGIGTVDDKTRAAFFETPIRLSDVEITALANENDLAAKCIEKRVREMFRRGYELEPVKTGKAGEGDIKASDLKGLLDWGNEDLKFDVRFQQGMKYGRQYGGSLLILGIDDGRPPWQPVDENNIRNINFINQIDRRFAYVQSYYSNYQRPKYGEARTYLVSNGVATSATRDDDLIDDEDGGFMMERRSPSTLRRNGYSILNIHESRVVRFDGIESDIITRQTLAGWSWSVLQRPYQVLRQTDTSFDSLCYLISDASQAVLKLKGLFRALESGNKTALEQRLKTIDKTRSVMRGIAIDAGGEEDFTRVGTPLTGIPESIDRMMQRCAAAFDMPLTELFGMSPAGMNATGESDRIKWYDTIGSDQTDYLQPQQLRVLRYMMLAKRGPMRGRVTPIKVHYHPLLAPSESEIADTRLKKAQADQIYVEMSGPVTPEVVALTLTDTYSSLNPTDIEAEMQAKTSFDPYEKDPVKSKESQALAEGHPAVQGDPKAGGGVKVPVPKPPTPPPTAQGGGGAGTVEGGTKEGQSPTVPLPGSSLHGGAVAPAGEGEGTPSDNQRKPAEQRAAEADKPSKKGDKVDPGPNVAKDVYKQLLKDFPAAAIAWVLAAQWEGPKEVDLSRIDFSTEDSWRATRNPEKVERFAEKLDELAPVIFVDRRGSDLLDPVDGHHRILAYKKKGLPVVGYVAAVQCKEGPWTDLHTMIQKPAGNGSTGGETSRQAPRGESSRSGTNPASRTGDRADGPVELPAGHKPFIVLPGYDKAPDGSAPPGFSCANCTFLRPKGDGTFACASPEYKTWAETSDLVDPETKAPVLDPSKACSDWFAPKGRGDSQPRADETHEHYAGEFEGAPSNKQVKQSSSDKARIYADAREAQGHQERFMAKMAEDLGAHTVHLGKASRPLAALNKGLDKPGPMIVIGGLKSEKRADEKATKENGGDWSKMGDLVRSTIAVDKVSDLKPMADKLRARMKAEGLELARAPNDRFSKPTASGYRDALLNVKWPNGHVGEIQLHVKPMLRAKENGGHEHYEKIRAITGTAEAEGRDVTPEERKAIDQADEGARKAYAPAWREAGGR